MSREECGAVMAGITVADECITARKRQARIGGDT